MSVLRTLSVLILLTFAWLPVACETTEDEHADFEPYYEPVKDKWWEQFQSATKPPAKKS